MNVSRETYRGGEIMIALREFRVYYTDGHQVYETSYTAETFEDALGYAIEEFFVTDFILVNIVEV